VIIPAKLTTTEKYNYQQKTGWWQLFCSCCEWKKTQKVYV